MMFQACASSGYITNINRTNNNNSISFTYSPFSDNHNRYGDLQTSATLTKDNFKNLYTGYNNYKRQNDNSNMSFSEWAGNNNIDSHWKNGKKDLYHGIFAELKNVDRALENNIDSLYIGSSSKEDFATKLMSQFPQSGSQSQQRERRARRPQNAQIPVDKNTMIASLESYQQRMDNLQEDDPQKIDCKKFKIRENTKWMGLKKDGLSMDLYEAEDGKEIFLGSLKLKNINGKARLSYKGKITDKVLHDAAILYVQALANGNPNNITSINISSDLTQEQAAKFRQELIEQGVAPNKITLPTQNMIDNENPPIRHNRPRRIQNSIDNMELPNNNPPRNRSSQNNIMPNNNNSQRRHVSDKQMNSPITMYNNYNNNDLLSDDEDDDELYTTNPSSITKV